MGLFTRPNSPYWWKRYPLDPATGTRRPDGSTKIHIDGGNRAQSAKNKSDATLQYQKDCTEVRAPRAKPRILFRDYAPIWLETYAKGHAGYEHEQSVVAILIEGLGHYYLDELTAHVIAVWRAEKAKTVKARTADRYIDVLRPMLSKAIDYLDENPIKGRNRMGEPKWEALKWEETPKRWFSKEEFGLFVQAIESKDAIDGIPQVEGVLFAYAAVETLLRRSSLLDLTWDRYHPLGRPGLPFPNFNPLNAKVQIEYSPVSPNLRQYLDQLPRGKGKDPIFASFFRESGRRATSDAATREGSAKNRVTRWFQEVCALAGLPATLKRNGLTPHAFRHSGATWLLEEKHSVKKVMELGGWKSAQLFIDTYCHTTAVDVAAMASSMFNHNVKVVPFETKTKRRDG